jgi:PEP-CTERM motif
MQFKLGFIAAASLCVNSAFAAPITPSFDSFGAQPTFTFGGSGIPNSFVAVTQLTGGVVLGLSATQRFSAPAPTNDGAGTFTALAGSPTANTLSGWNFDWYLASGTVAGKTFKLFYDFDPTTANDQATHGVINFGNAGGTGQVNQNSQNLGAGFLATTNALIGVTAPSFTPFNTHALGSYTFALVAFDSSNIELGRSAIAVAVVPEPGTTAMMLAGLCGMGLIASRRRK